MAVANSVVDALKALSRPPRRRLSRVTGRWHAAGDGRALSRIDRICYALGAGGNDPLGLVRRRLREDADGRPYFDLPAGRLDFVPIGKRVDREAAVDAAMIIVGEAYFGGADFFKGPVQLPRGGVALDLGGNFGTSAIAFHRLVGAGGVVYSFEPVFPDVLAENLKNAGIHRGVEVVPVAVGDHVGEIAFRVTDAGIDSRAAKPGQEVTNTYPLTTVDAFVAERGLDRLDLIKIDIEGAEEPALEGARETLARLRPMLTIASYHTDVESRKQHPRLVRLLGELGYDVEEVGEQHIYAWPKADATAAS